MKESSSVSWEWIWNSILPVYERIVWKVARHLGADYSLARDHVHDVLIALLQRRVTWPRFTNPVDGECYLVRAALNRGYRLHKRRLLLLGDLLDQNPTLEDRIFASASNVLTDLIQREDHARMLDAISRLSILQRGVLDLTLDGLTAREIGSVMNRRDGTVRFLKHLGIRTLRRILNSALIST